MEQSVTVTKSLRQIVQVVGLLEAIQPSTRQFTIRLKNDQQVPCVLVEGEISTLQALLGKQVFISGMGVWLPTGRLERVEVDRFQPDEDERNIWSWLPIPRFPSELPPEEPTPRPLGLEAIVGKWPGDETDEELLKALKEMD